MAAPIRVVNKETGAAYDLHGERAEHVLKGLQEQGFVAIGTSLPSGAVEVKGKKEQNVLDSLQTEPVATPPADEDPKKSGKPAS